jgi:hypothetical protein
MYWASDEVSSALASIRLEHLWIHNERMWSSSYPTTNIAGAGITNFIIRCDANVVHFKWRVEVDKAALVDLYEDPTVTVAGVAMAVLNISRGSAAATAVTCFSGSTIGVNGTFLEPHILGDAAAGGKTGDLHRSASEWEGLANEDYLLVVTTLGANTRINVNWRFYEEL